ncbi:MAG: STAS domain-containing protein [Acidobacteriota bacterium]
MEFYYHDTDKDVLILHADGGLSANTARRFVSELETLVEAGCRKLIVDCSRLHRLTSYGVGILVTLHLKMSGAGGEVKLASVPSRVVKLLLMAQLDSVLQIYRDMDEARAAFDA